MSASIYEESITGGSSHPLKGKVIVITGCASGIGKELAIHLAFLGCRLALTDSNPEEGRAVCGEVREVSPRGDVVFATLDVTNEEAVGKLMRTFLGTYKRIHGLVNCAGINPFSPPAHDLLPEFYNQMMSINAQGTFSFCQHFIKAIASPNNTLEPPPGGYSIVNIGGVENATGLLSQAVYKASKAAVVAFSKSLAREYAGKGIRVNVVSPGHIDTPLMTNLYESTQVTTEEAVELVPMKRAGEPLEVVQAIVFLLGPDSSYITGIELPVDGGLSA